MAFIFTALGIWCALSILAGAAWSLARKAQGPNRKPERHLRVVK